MPMDFDHTLDKVSQRKEMFSHKVPRAFYDELVDGLTDVEQSALQAAIAHEVMFRITQAHFTKDFNKDGTVIVPRENLTTTPIEPRFRK
jgi:hypothetical protein